MTVVGSTSTESAGWMGTALGSADLQSRSSLTATSTEETRRCNELGLADAFADFGFAFAIAFALDVGPIGSAVARTKRELEDAEPALFQPAKATAAKRWVAANGAFRIYVAT